MQGSTVVLYLKGNRNGKKFLFCLHFSVDIYYAQ